LEFIWDLGFGFSRTEWKTFDASATLRIPLPTSFAIARFNSGLNSGTTGAHHFMSTKVKVVLGVLAGATFMFFVFLVIVLGAMFFNYRSSQTSSATPAAAPPTAAPPAVRAAEESITPTHFDQITRLRVPSRPALQFRREPFTVTFWFRTTITNRPLAFIAKRAHTLGEGWVISTLEDHSLLFYAAGCATTKAPAPASRDGRWHHVAAVRNGTRLAFYLDGHEAGAGDNTCDFNDKHSIRIGMDAEPNGWHFEGDMAEVHFYNRPLGSAEIVLEWNAGQPVKGKVIGEGFVAGYHLGTGPAGTADFSGNGPDGEWIHNSPPR
jgi:hypothetical protein